MFGSQKSKLLVAALLFSVSLMARDVVESSGECEINWSDGFIACEGTSAADQSKFAATLSAKVIAQRNLLEVVKGVQIDSEVSVADGMISSDVIKSRVEGAIRGARVTNNIYDKEQKSATATVKLEMGKDLLEALLSDPTKLSWNEKIQEVFKNFSLINNAYAATYTVKDTATIKKVMEDLRSSGHKEASEYVAKLLDGIEKTTYTGILIDVSQLDNFKKAMIVKLVDQNGKEIYPGNLITKKMLVKKNTSVGYVFGHDDAVSDKRVFNTPIEIKAKQIYKNRHSDIVLDASQIEQLSSVDQKVFQNAKILLLLGE